MVPNVSAQLQEAGNLLRAGDRETAWQQLQPALDYPAGVEMSDAEFAQAIGMLALIGGDSLSQPTAAALAAARVAPTDGPALYQAGYHLIEADLPRAAATALARANTRLPDNPAVINELCAALEASGLHFDAYLALQQAYGARQQNWTTRYLYVFNAIMAGHMVDARQGFAELGDATDTTSQLMHDRLATYLARHKLMGSATSLDERDLRGWHYVVTGGLLTHISPHGIDEGMNGRYAFVQDRDELIHEGLLRAAAVLQAWGTRPGQLLYSRDRSSQILAHVWNERLGIPIREFRPADAASPGDTNATGLFLAYDLADADSEFLRAVELHRPGQILVSHASCWTEPAPFTSDISTFLYQSNISPWGADRMSIDPATNQVTRDAADETTPAVRIAERIARSTVPQAAIQDLGLLTAAARTVGLPAQSGSRDRFFVGSPVQSSRFS